MTEYQEKSMEEMASEFIVRTCQLIPKSYDPVSDCMHDPMAYGVHCGSAMEFYIRPVHQCITDIDGLSFRADELAFEGDFPVLPHDVSCLNETINCYKIEPYLKYPGFVRLRLLGKMTYNWKYKKYEFSHEAFLNRYCIFDSVYWATNSKLLVQYGALSHDVRGPAITMQYDERICPVDSVYCIWCPQWPREAEDWLRRSRNFGWPTIATVSEVVEHGCHIVYVQHRACRDDKEQWRLSFSVAEVILLQSWTHIQQIVYHLLRFLAKRELIQKDCPKEDEVLCTYHLKTLMLWNCEEMSLEWWNSYSAIAICCELLKKLSEWLKRKYCPNYFIRETNLFNLPLTSASLDRTERQLNYFCNCGILSDWFVEKYILPCTRTYEVVGNTGGLTLDFVDFILPILEFQQTLKMNSFDYFFSSGIVNCYNFIGYLIKFQTLLGPKSCLSYSGVTRKFDLVGLGSMAVLPIPESICCLTSFDTALCCLNAAYGLECGNMEWDSELFVDYVKGFCCKPKSVRCEFHRLPIPLTADRSQFQFWRAQDLMENLTGLNNPSEFQLLSLLSKGFLRKALECDDSRLNGIAPAASVYLAALHFATSEKQRVIDLCSTVLMDQVSHVEDETLNAGCLLFIDDVARIVGFSLLCKKFQENKHFIMRQIYLDLRLTPKALAHHLTVNLIGQSHPCLQTLEFALDQFLLALTRHTFRTFMKSSIISEHDIQCVYRRKETATAHATLRYNLLTANEKVIDALTKPKSIVSIKSSTHFIPVRQVVYRRKNSLVANVNTLTIKETVIGVLAEYSLENVTSFYNAIRKDFGIQCNTIDCYRALYLYKCRQYDEVLHLCERILKEPDLQSDSKKFAFANVLVVPSLHLFFDRDVQSLVGFHSLFWYLSPLDENIRKFETISVVKFSHLYALFVYCSKNPLLYCVSLPYSIKYLYSLGRHFLAKYLKLRCYIDCNHPLTEAVEGFAAINCDLPFEHVIRRFLLQSLRKDQK